jgi:hypothetical protein
MPQTYNIMPPQEQVVPPRPKPVSVFLKLRTEKRFFEISTTDLEQDEWTHVSKQGIIPALALLVGHDVYEHRTDVRNFQNLLANSLEGQSIRIEGFHTAIFGYYALWLQNKSFILFQDISVSMTSTCLSKSTTVDQSAVHRPDVTMEEPADDRHDQDPAAMSMARRLFCAYFIGQDLQTPYFQDTIMNAIVQFFRPDQKIPPTLVDEAYSRSNPGLVGLKKFLVDYYIWSCMHPSTPGLPRLCVSSGLSESQILPLSCYLRAFHTGVTITHQSMRTEALKEANVLSRPREKEHKDTEIDFSNLNTFIRNAKEGMIRCHYHQHTHVDLCLNLMV